jgi:hypothetical protein
VGNRIVAHSPHRGDGYFFRDSRQINESMFGLFAVVMTWATS